MIPLPLIMIVAFAVLVHCDEDKDKVVNTVNNDTQTGLISHEVFQKLLRRYSSCPSGYPLDCNDGYCCPSGSKCARGGQCEIVKCPDEYPLDCGDEYCCPSGSKCAEGGKCNKGKCASEYPLDCGNGYCCPSDTKCAWGGQCETKKCSDGYPLDCGDGYCCPLGYTCIGGGKCSGGSSFNWLKIIGWVGISLIVSLGVCIARLKKNSSE